MNPSVATAYLGDGTNELLLLTSPCVSFVYYGAPPRSGTAKGAACRCAHPSRTHRGTCIPQGGPYLQGHRR